MPNFFYKKGPLEITTPWERPTSEPFNYWLKEILPKADSLGYRLWLHGGFLSHKENTWDIDIIVTQDNGKIFDYKKLRDFMLDACKIGHNRYNILIDIQFYCNFLGRTFQKEGVDSFYYSSKDYKINGRKFYLKICFFNQVWKNGKLLTNWTKNSIQIYPQLYLIFELVPSLKRCNKIDNGEDYQPPIELTI